MPAELPPFAHLLPPLQSRKGPDIFVAIGGVRLLDMGGGGWGLAEIVVFLMPPFRPPHNGETQPVGDVAGRRHPLPPGGQPPTAAAAAAAAAAAEGAPPALLLPPRSGEGRVCPHGWLQQAGDSCRLRSIGLCKGMGCGEANILMTNFCASTMLCFFRLVRESVGDDILDCGRELGPPNSGEVT